MLKVIAIIIAEWRHTVANYITLGRAMIGHWGLNVFYFYVFDPWLMLLLCVVSGALDWLDGWWAKTFNEVSLSGKLLDPLCDKLLGWNVVVVFMCYFIGTGDYVLIAVMLVCIPPLVLNGLYDWMTITLRSSDQSMQTNRTAQKKQAFLFVSFGLLLLALVLHHHSTTMKDFFENLATYTTSVLFAMLGTIFLLRAVPLLAESARTYFSQTNDARAQQIANAPGVRFLLAHL